MNKKALFVAGVLFLIVAMVVAGGGAGLYFWLSEEDDTVTPAEVKLAETTKIFDQSALQHLLSISEDGVTLTFGAEAAQARSLSQGDVIACDATEQTPYGLLREVTDVQEGDNQIVVNTTDATLEDAIEEGTIEARCSLSPDDDESDTVLETTIDEVLYENEAGKQIRVTGELSCEADLDLDAEISGAQLRRLDFGIAMDETARLRIEGDVSLDDFSSDPVEVLRRELPTITVRVGDLPIPITPVLRVSVGCEGAMARGMTVDVTQRTSADMGVQYERGDWAAVKTLRQPSFDWGEPSVPADCQARAYVQRELDFELYGEAGPNARTVGYMEVRSDSSSWELDGGIEGDVGLRTKMIAGQDDYVPGRVIDERTQLDQGTVKAVIPERDITGTVRDATTNDPLEGVTVDVYDGDDLLATETTDSEGSYVISVPVGSGYRVEFSKTGYIAVEETDITVDAIDGATVDAVMSPELSAGETRIVLTWGAEPSDLDSHLTGPLSDGSSFHIYWADQGAGTEGEDRVELDVDDTSSYGPETITILNQIDGVYQYSVHNYSSWDPTPISDSQAQVNVYQGSELVATYDVPDEGGTLWTVFELHGDAITPINTMSSAAPP